MNTRIGEQEANAAFWKNDNVLKNGEKASSVIRHFSGQVGNFWKVSSSFLQFRHGIFRNHGGREKKHIGFVKSIESAGQGIELVWEKSLLWTILGGKGMGTDVHSVTFNIFTDHWNSIIIFYLLSVQCIYYKSIHNIKAGVTGLQQL